MCIRDRIETVTIAPADYPTKVQTAMRGKQTTPDIIVGEPQMLQDMYEAEMCIRDRVRSQEP